MRNIKFITSLALLVFVSFALRVEAQTSQLEFVQSGENIQMLCLDENVSGTWTYHVTWHQNPKTGLVDRLHWNVQSGEFIGVDTGKKYKIHDTGSDTQGYLWDAFAYFGAIAPGDFVPHPTEGRIVNMNFKWMSKGLVYKGHILVRMNFENGVPVPEFVHYDLCVPY